MASEVSHAGCVLLSHMDEAEEADVQETIDHLKRALEEIQCKRDLTGVILKKAPCSLNGRIFEAFLLRLCAGQLPENGSAG